MSVDHIIYKICHLQSQPLTRLSSNVSVQYSVRFPQIFPFTLMSQLDKLITFIKLQSSIVQNVESFATYLEEKTDQLPSFSRP